MYSSQYSVSQIVARICIESLLDEVNSTDKG